MSKKKKDKKWIQKASADIKKRGTEGVCTGDKFGGSTCPPGSRRYNLAKVFRGMARKRKKAATGAMIKAKNSALISHQKAYDLAKAEKGEDRITKADIAYQRTKHLKGRIGRNATGAMIHAKKSKYIQGTASAKDTLKGIDKILGVLPGGAYDWKAWKKPAKKATGGILRAQTGELVREKTRGTGAAITGDTHVVMKGMDAAQTGKLIQVPTRGTGAAVTGNQHYVMQGMDAAKHGKIIKAKTSTFAETHAANWAKRRGAATTGMRVGTAGTAYTSPGWTTKINKSLNKLKDMMKLGSSRAGRGLSRYKGKIPKAAQLKNLAKVGGSRATWLMGGPMGAAALSATLAPSVIDKLTKRAPGATKTKLFGIDIKGAEKSARTREALMAKRNTDKRGIFWKKPKAKSGGEIRGYKRGAEIIAPSSNFVIRPKPTSQETVLEQKPINNYTKDLL